MTNREMAKEYLAKLLSYDHEVDGGDLAALTAMLEAVEARGESRGAERERANAERFARYIVWKCPNEHDHACAQCYPNGDAVVCGFVCTVHAASAYALKNPGGAT